MANNTNSDDEEVLEDMTSIYNEDNDQINNLMHNRDIHTLREDNALRVEEREMERAEHDDAAFTLLSLSKTPKHKRKEKKGPIKESTKRPKMRGKTKKQKKKKRVKSRSKHPDSKTHVDKLSDSRRKSHIKKRISRQDKK